MALSPVQVISASGGVASYRDIVAASGRHALRVALAAGAVTRLGRNRYGLPGPDTDLVAAFGNRACLSHVSAAVHHGWGVLHDSALRSGSVSHADLVHLTATVRAPGIVAARRVVAHADGRAANPFESALRSIVLQVGLRGFVPQLVVTAVHTEPVRLDGDLAFGVAEVTRRRSGHDSSLRGGPPTRRAVSTAPPLRDECSDVSGPRSSAPDPPSRTAP